MKSLHVGKVGKDFTVEEGAAFARTIGLELCATLKTAVGDLDKVKKIVKLVGFVNWCVRTCAHPAHGTWTHDAPARTHRALSLYTSCTHLLP
jgi:hypothetical protein